MLEAGGFVLLQLFLKCLKVPLHCVRKLDVSLHLSPNPLAIDTRHMQAPGVLDLREGGKGEGKKGFVLKVHIYLCC